MSYAYALYPFLGAARRHKRGYVPYQPNRPHTMLCRNGVAELWPDCSLVPH
ncbi:hypothetical protein AcetOrient_orf02272 [Acetobacter orientalis]|uniref:Uncharacterized protein n=1 Tax=Acetobacter orientalis TaxID=146474 RepID=A0A2Z5ZHM7_9PROT|nr:hypothetical protein AcetOrient_orf02272 [Acetobacter orientalis]